MKSVTELKTPEEREGRGEEGREGEGRGGERREEGRGEEGRGGERREEGRREGTEMRVEWHGHRPQKSRHKLSH